MVEWSAFVVPAFGGLLSGLTGVALVEYRRTTQERDELVAWYDRTIRFAVRVQEAGFDDGSEGNVEHTVRLYEALAERLRDQLLSAPSRVDADTIDRLDRVTTLTGLAASRAADDLETGASGIERYFGGQFDRAAAEAELLEEVARAGRAGVGWV